MTSNAKRIYIVIDDKGAETLVRATSPHQALGFLVRSRFAVRVAQQEDLVRLLSTGPDVLDANSPGVPNSRITGAVQEAELFGLP